MPIALNRHRSGTLQCRSDLGDLGAVDMTVHASRHRESSINGKDTYDEKSRQASGSLSVALKRLLWPRRIKSEMASRQWNHPIRAIHSSNHSWHQSAQSKNYGQLKGKGETKIWRTRLGLGPLQGTPKGIS